MAYEFGGADRGEANQGEDGHGAAQKREEEVGGRGREAVSDVVGGGICGSADPRVGRSRSKESTRYDVHKILGSLVPLPLFVRKIYTVCLQIWGICIC